MSSRRQQGVVQGTECAVWCLKSPAIPSHFNPTHPTPVTEGCLTHVLSVTTKRYNSLQTWPSSKSSSAPLWYVGTMNHVQCATATGVNLPSNSSWRKSLSPSKGAIEAVFVDHQLVQILRFQQPCLKVANEHKLWPSSPTKRKRATNTLKRFD